MDLKKRWQAGSRRGPGVREPSGCAPASAVRRVGSLWGSRLQRQVLARQTKVERATTVCCTLPPMFTEAVSARPEVALPVLPPLTAPRAPAPARGLDHLSDRIFLPWLADARDVAFTRALADVVVYVLPFSVALFLLPTPWLAVFGPLYLAHVFVNYAARIVLMLHAVTHRPVFLRRFRAADALFTKALPLIVGLPPFAYNLHHRLMHHRENVSESDLSGTAEYQRDNLLQFVHYLVRFAFFGYVHIASWGFRRGLRREVLEMLAWSLAGYAVVGVLTWWMPGPMLFLAILPYLLLRVFLMAGNWSEHAFVEVDDPTDSWRNSVCLLNTGFNHRAYNAGYHLVHHIVPSLHWADHPAWLEEHRAELALHDVLMFDGVRSNQQVWWKLMTGDYHFLAERMVDPMNRRPSIEERIAFLKSRVKRTRGTRKGLLEFREAGLGIPSGRAFSQV